MQADKKKGIDKKEKIREVTRGKGSNREDDVAAGQWCGETGSQSVGQRKWMEFLKSRGIPGRGNEGFGVI